MFIGPSGLKIRENLFLVFLDEEFELKEIFSGKGNILLLAPFKGVEDCCIGGESLDVSSKWVLFPKLVLGLLGKVSLIGLLCF